MRTDKRSARIQWLAGLSILLLSGIANAFNMIPVTPMEWDSWPRICQGMTTWTVVPPEGRKRPPLSQKEQDYIKSLGLWHFCQAYVRLQRLELKSVRNRRAEIDFALDDIMYVYRQLDPREGRNARHPMFAPVGVAYARLMREARKRHQALEILDTVKKYHPSYPPMYTVYTALLFDQKQYRKAVEILEEGNRKTGDRIGEIQYFLGLSYLNIGEIEKARIFERKARENKYPFRALTRKLAAHDARQAAKKSAPALTDSVLPAHKNDN